MAKIFTDPSKHDLLDLFNHTFRYLDDVLALNNPEFSKFADEIYLKELTLTMSKILMLLLDHYIIIKSFLFL